MQILDGFANQPEAITTLFTEVFSASDGAAEGEMIRTLVTHLIATTAPTDIACFTAWDDTTLCGGLFFSRLVYARDPRTFMLLSPVAVRPNRQRTGIGQALIRHGLAQIAAQGCDIAVTYGDPAYYGKTGFAPVTQDTLPAPYPLQMPHGWQAQCLTSNPIGQVTGPASCVDAFRDPTIW